MTLDPTTLLIATGLIVAVCGVTFIVSTSLRRNERFGRLWSIAFVAGILETVSTFVWALSDAGWWAGPVGNGALVLAIGLMWAGCREYNGRYAYSLVPIIAGNLVAVVGLFEGPDGGYWAGAESSFAGIVVFSILASVEAMRGALRRSVEARVLAMIFGVVGFYYLLRLIVFVAAGPDTDVFTAYFSTTTTTFFALVLVIVAAISMTALQSRNVPGIRDPSEGRSRAIPGVIDAAQFEVQATDWLARSRRDKESLVMVTLAVDGLDHINSAFGREFGDQTIFTVGRIACENAPSAAIVAHAGAGRFMILASAPQFGSPIAIAERLQTALVETPVDVDKGIRAIAACGVACTDDHGYDLAALTTATATALAAATASGHPGAIELC